MGWGRDRAGHFVRHTLGQDPPGSGPPGGAEPGPGPGTAHSHPDPLSATVGLGILRSWPGAPQERPGSPFLQSLRLRAGTAARGDEKGLPA